MYGTFDEQWNADDLRIDLDTPFVLAYWANQLGVTHDELRDAVSSVGPVLRNVKKQIDISREKIVALRISKVALSGAAV